MSKEKSVIAAMIDEYFGFGYFYYLLASLITSAVISTLYLVCIWLPNNYDEFDIITGCILVWHLVFLFCWLFFGIAMLLYFRISMYLDDRKFQAEEKARQEKYQAEKKAREEKYEAEQKAWQEKYQAHVNEIMGLYSRFDELSFTEQEKLLSGRRDFGRIQSEEDQMDRLYSRINELPIGTVKALFSNPRSSDSDRIKKLYSRIEEFPMRLRAMLFILNWNERQWTIQWNRYQIREVASNAVMILDGSGREIDYLCDQKSWKPARNLYDVRDDLKIYSVNNLCFFPWPTTIPQFTEKMKDFFLPRTENIVWYDEPIEVNIG